MFTVKHSLYLLAIVVLIGKVYPDNGLYCSHSDFLQTILAEPTAYCIISGMSFNLVRLYIYIYAMQYYTTVTHKNI